MIDSRSKVHPEWVSLALKTLKGQIYPLKEIIVIDNTLRERTIGECWNEAVKKASGDWCLFVGDDDFFARDLTLTFNAWSENMDATAFSCYMTAIESDNSRNLYRPFTGMWKRDYLLGHPFDETLTRGVDREYTQEAVKNGEKFVAIPHYFGYYYRQHDNKTCKKVDVNVPQSEIYIQSTYANFIIPFYERLKEERDVYLDAHPFSEALSRKSKVIWCDWGDENAVKVADFDTDAKKILRIHAYEVFRPMVHYIDFDKYDKIVFVAEHIKNYLEEKLKRKLNAEVIPNFVDFEKFYLKKTPKNNKIAFLGQISRKKGIPLALFLAKNLPDYEFHLAGDIIEDDVYDLIRRKNYPNVFLHRKQYDVPKYFEDKTYVLNTSAREGNPVSVIEGMTMGLKPLVYNWVGAKEQFPFVWETLDEFKSLLDDVRPEEYREYARRYDFNNIYPKLRALI